MKRFVLVAAGLIFAGMSVLADAAAASLLIRNVNLVTLDSRGTIAEGALLLRGGKIARVYEKGAALPRADRTVDGAGGFLMPGLIDAHTHFDGAEQLKDYLRYGVTTIFSLGTRDEDRAALNTAVAQQRQGKLPGTRIYATGPSIGNHRNLEVSQVAAYVDELKRDGLSFVKVYNAIPEPVFYALTDAAHARGMGVFGHIPRTFPADRSLRKIDIVAHMEEFFFALNRAVVTDSALPQLQPDWQPDLVQPMALLDVVKAHDGAIVPNLVASAVFRTLWFDEDAVLGLPDSARLDAETRDGWRQYNHSRRNLIEKRALREEIKQPYIRRLTFEAHKKGVTLLAGSDAPLPGIFPGRSMHQELRMLVSAGLTNEEALRTATINGGKAAKAYVDGTTCIGSLEAGCEADLILLDADPAADIRNVSRIRKVYADGVEYDPQQLVSSR